MHIQPIKKAKCLKNKNIQWLKPGARIFLEIPAPGFAI